MKIVGDRMKEKIKNVLKYVLTFVILMSIFNICLYLVCSFNSSSVEENVKESYHTKNINYGSINNTTCEGQGAEAGDGR